MTKLSIMSIDSQNELLYKNFDAGEQMPRIGDTLKINEIKYHVVEIVFMYDSERPTITNIQIWIEEV